MKDTNKNQMAQKEVFFIVNANTIIKYKERERKICELRHRHRNNSLIKCIVRA